MDKRKSKLILNLLCVFWWIILALSFVEAITYSGFTFRHLHIRLVTTILIFALSAIWFSTISKDAETWFQVASEKISKGLVVVLGLLTISMPLLESITYDNYVFSKFHIRPELLHVPFTVTIILFLVRKKNVKILLSLRTAFYTLLFLVLWYESGLILKSVRENVKFMISYPNASYDEKMAYAIGEKFYYYVKFVKENTPENSTILIPPQGFPWPQTGNAPYMRYFLYPRSVVNGKEYEPGTNTKKLDYILIAWGETEGTQFGYSHSWPKFDIPSSEFILMDTENKSVRKHEDYSFKNFIGKEIWGLVILK